MNVPQLLRSKTTVPQQRRQLVARSRLIEQLNQALNCKLTLVSSPAGYGKTTLLSAWAAQCELPVAWITLDEDDNDPARFLILLTAALESIKVHLGDGIQQALLTQEAIPVENLLVVLVQQANTGAVQDAQDEQPFVLVLDDYHLIKSDRIHDAVSVLLDYLQPDLHLVLATRADPPLPVARLRGQGQLCELRQRDLCFTQEEARDFMNRVMGLALTEAQIQALERRTEGWAAGMQMAALSLQGQEEAQTFIQAFTGSDRYILDYLVEEVLQRQTSKTQEFLLRTSILQRMCGPLCDAVLGQAQPLDLPGADIGGLPPSQELLEHLERANLFIVPLDNHREWYRYHLLFADLLRLRLSRESPDLARALHQRASLWHERGGWMAEAIYHALHAQDFERAAQLVEAIADETVGHGQYARFIGWLEALPEKKIQERPLLCLFSVWGLLHTGQTLDKIEARMQIASQHPGSEAFSTEIHSLRAVIAMYRGQIQMSIKSAQRALQSKTVQSPFLCRLAIKVLGTAYLMLGDLANASQILEKEINNTQHSDNLAGTVSTLQSLGAVRTFQGRLQEARAIYCQATEIAMDDKGRYFPNAAKVLAGLANVLREQNELEAAEAYALKGVESSQGQLEAYGMACYLMLATIRQAQGDHAAALQAIHKAKQMAIAYDIMDMDDIMVAAYQAHILLAQGDLDGATQWAQERGLLDLSIPDRLPMMLENPPTFYHILETELTCLARLYLAQGQFELARKVLEGLLNSARQLGRMTNEIEASTLLALISQAQGDTELALDHLERALRLAEPQGYVRIFIDEGRLMAGLLYEAARRGIAPAYTRRLLATFPEAEAQPATPPLEERKTEALVEPLSERETQVLHQIAVGLTNREIAERLYLSLSTVKVHTYNIYSKLNVHNRTQAVARARGLGILQ